MAVPVNMATELVFGRPRRLFAVQGRFPFAASDDGQRFLTTRLVDQSQPGLTIAVVQNWYAEFKNQR